MPEYKLSDEQWLVLDLLMGARKRGVHQLNRMEVLHNAALPQSASVKLTWAALTMPKELLTWVSHHDFSITDQGASIYNLRFGYRRNHAPEPTEMVESVIYLPGPDHRPQS